MFEKAKDPKVIAKKISHKPIDYEKLNRLTDDFGKRFSPQQEVSAEQAFWFHILNPSIESSHTPPVIVEVPSELPKVSLVNASLKKLKFHLTQFDSVVKNRTPPNALKEGEWGFEHTKTVFNNEIIPFLKSLKDIFNVFDKDLLNEITEVQTVFDQIDAAVQQSSVDKQCLEIAKKEILLENDRLLQKIMSQDVLLTVMNSMSLNNDYVNMEMQKCELCEKCLNLDAELSKSKQAYNDFLKNYSQLEKHCISLEASMQLLREVFQHDESCVNQNAVEIQEYFEINDLKARLQDKDKTICKLKDTIKSLRDNTKEENVNHDKYDHEPINKELGNSVAKLLSDNKRLCNDINHVKQVSVITSSKNDLRKLKGKEIVENVIHTPSVTTIAPGMFKLDLVPFPPSELDFACKYATRIQELLVYVQDTFPNAITPTPKNVAIIKPMNNVKNGGEVKCSTSNYGSKPPDNKRNDKISQTPSRIKKNKIEAQPKKVNKVNRVVKPVCDVDVKHSLSKANSKILCATCNKSMFDGVHDKCLLDLVLQIILWYLDSGCSKHMTGNALSSELCINLMEMINLVRLVALGKSKKSSHQPKAEDTNQEKLYLLHMDLCYPIRVASINGKMYILVIVHDYLRFTWVRFLKTKDEAPTAIIKCIKNIQVCLKATIRNVRTDNGTEFVNQTLREWYENVGIMHQTSVARTLQQNGVVERQNRTLVEAAQTMLIFSKASLFL
ncbi:integrase, catalytic region, zinc finger, CCHC-type containing protein [Tanacetum coccineum]|uniref:Integrase, catalytic region, zinc finger, CCHC-type containing protein n=1 Tax=Tanacetum coccineum TaxID=301880 RepID=A0ABQ5G3Z9_9ASTR